ncbi:cytochrome c-type biogenesis protein [Novilysobacter avium]|uniref:Cytochrome c-type biogenesis protein n=1 Tax=Novilysobacter avium TaxID=2781023 RepID=A0A7S6ZWD5_9GAMM|nr:cytochrome c-type biogenesis protein [Lysobacter avium]QOW23099.1 cytochrome c-type biogenesis protein CcmH [Lysobacter avium]
MRRSWPLILLLALLLPALAVAQAVRDPSPMQFTDQAEADRFHDLAGELRCVKCQNQSLADSNAAIAQDLRHEVLTLMRQGKSNAEVKDYLVARYGEFVLYRPRMDTKTWLLWFGPALVLLAGAVVVVNVVRRHSRMAAAGPPDSIKATAAVDEDQEW